MDNVGIVVESLDNAIAFFTKLGLKLEGLLIGLAEQLNSREEDGYPA